MTSELTFYILTRERSNVHFCSTFLYHHSQTKKRQNLWLVGKHSHLNFKNYENFKNFENYENFKNHKNFENFKMFLTSIRQLRFVRKLCITKYFMIR